MYPVRISLFCLFSFLTYSSCKSAEHRPTDLDVAESKTKELNNNSFPDKKSNHKEAIASKKIIFITEKPVNIPGDLNLAEQKSAEEYLKYIIPAIVGVTIGAAALLKVRKDITTVKTQAAIKAPPTVKTQAAIKAPPTVKIPEIDTSYITVDS